MNNSIRLFVILFAAISSNMSFGFDKEDGIEYDCGISKCRVECVGPGDRVKQFAKGSKVTVYSQSNGTTIFEVKAMGGNSQTIIAGGDNYICSIKGHR